MGMWNIRSMNQKKKQEAVLNLIHDEKISICGIVETHLKPSKIDKVAEKAFGGWDWVSNSSHSMNSCRILVGWDKNKINLMMVHMTNQVMLTIVEILDSKQKFFCSFVYACNSGSDRRNLWEELRKMKMSTSGKPWILMGDFNVTLRIEEHSAGGSRRTKDMQEFLDCVNDIEVEDVNQSGLHFTWIKSPSQPTTSILKKLDRVMINTEFLSKFGGSNARFQPFLISDHSPVVVTIPNSLKDVKKAFRLSNFITDKVEFNDVVKENWYCNCDGYNMYKLVKKLKILKGPLKKLAWKNGNMFQYVKALEEDLKKAQIKVEENPFDAKVKEDMINILYKYNEALNDEEKLLAQKAKVKWLSEGDRNTKYFHNIVKSRMNKNKIMGIYDEHGNWYEGELLPDQFVKHFQKFLSKDGNSVPFEGNGLFQNVLNTQEANMMISEVSDKEIKEAMFGIGDDKAPGPDGFTSKFFKKSWKTTGKDVCEAVREFFKTNKLLGEVNATLITLVPKIHNPNKVSDYRPIACCNVIYKCISKIITNRITGCLDKLISINQSAFVPGRIIQDNLLITQELLKGYNKKSGPARCALKIDIAKAYDTVDWKFLNDIMLNFGFHEKFVGWVMTCVSSAAFTICINGERYGYFKSGRGLRQGDPMSPYLFTLVMEVLTLMVNRRIERENHFKYHWGCKDIKLAQLCFADDLLMLCNGDHQSVKTLKDGLMEFSKSSGLIPNMNKSTIFFGSIKEDEKKRILDVMPFKVGQLPMKYLGVPLITKNIGVSECNQLVDRVKQKVNDWKNKNLSYAGRLQLIAAVLASMHVYWASVFLLPKTTVKDIDKVLKGFLWSQGELKKGAARVAWKIICDPKSKGGLGIKKLGPWNEALLCKHLWNIIIKKESLWVKWVNVVKLKGKSIWEVQCENNDSGTWKAILNLREKIRENVWNKIGDGKSTNMWFDRWCVEGPLCDVIPFRKRYEARLDEKTKVRDMVENNEWVWPISWKTTFCNITRIKVPTLVEGSKDYAFWKDTKGNEVQASIRIIWENFKEEKEDVKWHKAVWFSQGNPRHAFILWLVMHRRLLLMDKTYGLKQEFCSLYEIFL
ncbi:RNA-directed DNA polymerase, eukaryota, reverse transcriptase zinc-binding domain protein [Tanacetum coccineum]